LFFKSYLRGNTIELIIFAGRLRFNETSMLNLVSTNGIINGEQHVSAEKQ
jgi:hypothetical protein